ncbi:hypothetical protein C9374_004114 [Naegleria lovaniensis]|uniref:RGS domain-containing protein n=1 Tax=Naegleria lovaniensis TaxID=51637 RepID=A0AA88GSN9_NAELO|nr:uncharacterized protein C9374_004114 [Naegleria lovaniensis]KAG2383443.1 hypothetical protein C9374_004114 [Naegleria lovaniensis]
MTSTIETTSYGNDKNNNILSPPTSNNNNHQRFSTSATSTCTMVSTTNSSIQSGGISETSMGISSSSSSVTTKTTSTTTTNGIQIGVVSSPLMNMFEKEMVVNPCGASVLELSKDHVVLLVVIKWFGCPLCQSVISRIQEYLPSFLMMNIVPIICHQENEEKASSKLAHTNLMNCRVTSQVKTNLLEMDLKKEFENASKPDIPKLLKLFPNMKGIFKEGKKKRLQITSSLGHELETPRGDHKGASSPLSNSVAESNTSFSTQLDQILENVTMRTYFKAFLSNIFSLELVMFIEQVNVYKVLCKAHTSKMQKQLQMQQQMSEYELTIMDIQTPPNERNERVLSYNGNEMHSLGEDHQVCAQQIIETFFEEDSIFEINTSQKLVQRMKLRMQNEGCVMDLFDELVRDIKATMLYPLYSSFETTDIYKSMSERMERMKKMK